MACLGRDAPYVHHLEYSTLTNHSEQLCSDRDTAVCSPSVDGSLHSLVQAEGCIGPAVEGGSSCHRHNQSYECGEPVVVQPVERTVPAARLVERDAHAV